MPNLIRLLTAVVCLVATMVAATAQVVVRRVVMPAPGGGLPEVEWTVEDASASGGDNLNLSSLSLSTGMVLPLGRIEVADGRMLRLPALSVSTGASVAVGDDWGVGLELGLISTPLQIEQHLARTQVATLSSLGVMVAPYRRFPLSGRIGLRAEAAAGYYHNFKLRTIDCAITAGAGTPAARVGVSVEMRLGYNIRCRASAGCQVSGYSFTVRPSAAYGITRPDHVSGLTSALILGISSSISF